MDRVAALWLRAGLVAVLVFGLTACSGSDAPSESSSSIVVSTAVWGDIVDNVVCESLDDEVQVDVLLDAAADPHTADVSLEDRASLDQAKLIIINGGGLEASLNDTIEAAREQGTPVLDLAAALSDQVHTGDAHFWLDPSIVSAALDPIVESLSAVGLSDSELKACAEAYDTSLEGVDLTVAKQFYQLTPEQRTLAAVHAFDYFADHYDLDIVATLSSTDSHAAPSAAHIAETIDAIKASGTRVMASDVYGHSDDLEAVESAVPDLTDVPVIISGLGQDAENDTYLTMIQWNGDRLAAAMGQ